MLTAVMLATTLALSAERPDFIRGADMSFIPQYEKAGTVFYEGDKPTPPLESLAKRGMNLLRIRLWLDHPEGHCSLERTIDLAKRAKALRMKVLLNFHYSDNWADPAKQVKPKAWADLGFEDLVKKVREYSKETVEAMAKAGAAPDMVQIGNEIIGGMLFPDGRMRDQESAKLATLVKAGIEGTKAGLPGRDVQIMIHIDRGGDQSATRWFFDNMEKEKVEFDVIGQSYYPFWHGDLDALRANLKMMAERYKKPIVVVETAYAFTLERKDGPSNFVNEEKQLLPGYPATPSGQASFLRDIRKVVSETPNGLGMGVVYWAPEYVADPGIQANPYENLTLWDFDNRLIDASASALFAPQR